MRKFEKSDCKLIPERYPRLAQFVRRRIVESSVLDDMMFERMTADERNLNGESFCFLGRLRFANEMRHRMVKSGR